MPERLDSAILQPTAKEKFLTWIKGRLSNLAPFIISLITNKMTRLEKKPTVDVTFQSISSTAFEVKKIQLQMGEKVKLQLNGVGQLPVKWFADNDPVLEIDEHGDHAFISATGEGASLIECQVNGKTILTFPITVTKKQIISTKGEIIFSKPEQN